MSPRVTIQSELIDDAQTETASVDQLERDIRAMNVQILKLITYNFIHIRC